MTKKATKTTTPTKTSTKTKIVTKTTTKTEIATKTTTAIKTNSTLRSNCGLDSNSDNKFSNPDTTNKASKMPTKTSRVTKTRTSIHYPGKEHKKKYQIKKNEVCVIIWLHDCWKKLHFPSRESKRRHNYKIKATQMRKRGSKGKVKAKRQRLLALGFGPW